MTTPVAPTAAANPANGVAPTRSAQREGGGSTLGTFGVKSGLAQMLKGGVIMDVVNAEQVGTSLNASCFYYNIKNMTLLGTDRGGGRSLRGNGA
jgi:hypothetical protein